MKQKRFAEVDDDAHRMEQSARLRTDLNSLDRAARWNESWANISLHFFCSDELTERSSALRNDPIDFA